MKERGHGMSERGSSEERGGTATSEGIAPSGPGHRPGAEGLLPAAVALIWLAAMLWSARASISGRELAEIEVSATAYALPGVVAASLVAGLAVAHAAVTVLANGRGTTARFTLAATAGLVTGLLAAVSIIAAYAEGWLYAVVAGTVAAAATIGGALAGLPAPRVVAAVIWSSLAVLAIGVGMNVASGPLLRSVFGAGQTAASQWAALSRFAWTQAVITGLAAGAVAFMALRRARHRANGTDVAWGRYGLAGAGAGVLLLITEVLLRTAGDRVLDLAGRVSVLESQGQAELAGRRLSGALVVAFVGAFVALIAVGRTIRPRSDG